MRLGSLFSGYGGLDMAVESVLGTSTAWVSDIDPGACKILAHRYPDVPNLGDITAVDWSAIEPVDVLTGGFPCQDVSHAGKRAGLGEGTRSGLWSHMAYAIDHLRPALVFAENVRGLLSAEASSDVEPCPWCMGGAADGEPALRALGAVLADLAELGYDAAWHGLRAADIGAPHGRFRVFVLAWPAADTDGPRPEGSGRAWPHRGDVAFTHGLDGPAANPTGDGRHEGGTEPTGQLGRPDAAECGDVAADSNSDGLELVGGLDALGCDADGCGGADIAWGPYEPAIRRWADILGRPAPAPTQPGPRGNAQLAPRFVEWMQGLMLGHVTEVPDLSRNEQLKALGNGVVPQQAAHALRVLLGHVVTLGRAA